MCNNNEIIILAIENSGELQSVLDKAGNNITNAVAKFIFDKYKNQEFDLSDGIKAIIDKSDAKKISHNLDKKRIAEIDNLKTIVEKAKYTHSDNHAIHKKFHMFKYYEIDIAYNEKIFSININVGKSKSDGKYHIYAITKKTSTLSDESRLRGINTDSFLIRDVFSNENISLDQTDVNNPN